MLKFQQNILIDLENHKLSTESVLKDEGYKKITLILIFRMCEEPDPTPNFRAVAFDPSNVTSGFSSEP